MHHVLQYFNVYSMYIQYTFNVYSIIAPCFAIIQCVFNVHSTSIQCVFNVYSMYIQCYTLYMLFSLMVTHSHIPILEMLSHLKSDKIRNKLNLASYLESLPNDSWLLNKWLLICINFSYTTSFFYRNHQKALDVQPNTSLR